MPYEFKPYDFKSTTTDIGEKEGADKSIIKKATSLLTSIINPKQGNSVKIKIPNMHTISVDIGGLQFMHENGCTVRFTELNDYKNLDFPIRRLEITMPMRLATKLYKLKGDVIPNFPKALATYIQVIPVSKSRFQEKPIESGAYVGILQDNEMKVKVQDAVNTKSESSMSPITVKLQLYKPGEIHYQSKASINFNMPNPTPSQLIQYAFKKSFNTYQLCMSKIENDKPMGRFIVPFTSFTDLIKFIDQEINLYSTKYYTCVDGDTFYLLNSDNNPNVDNAKLTTNLSVLVVREGTEKVYPRVIVKLGKTDYRITESVANVSVKVIGSSSYRDNKIYVTPSGKHIKQTFPMSRNQEVVFKNSEALPGKKLDNTVYEEITINCQGLPVQKFTPLSNIITTDAKGNMRVYRFTYKELNILSSAETNVTIKGVRLIDGDKDNVEFKQQS